MHDEAASGQVDVNNGEELKFYDVDSAYSDDEVMEGMDIPWHDDDGHVGHHDDDGSDSDSDSDSAGQRQFAKDHVLWQFAIYGTVAVLFHLRVL